MSTFRGGPADGVTLLFKRSPLYLRVVERPGVGFDVLDQLDDVPDADEVVHVYRRVGPSMMAHVNLGGRRGGFYEFVDYRHVELHEDLRAELRDTEAWRRWVERTADARGES